MNEVLQVFDVAVARIRRGHCKGAYARDASGNAVDSDHPLAVCWCLLGAIGEDVRPTINTGRAAYAAVRRLTDVRGSTGFNDDPATTSADVIALLERAASTLRVA